MNIPSIEPTGLFLTVVAALGAILGLRLKNSKVAKQVDTDAAERNSVAFVIAERDRQAVLAAQYLALLRASEVLNEKLTGKVEALSSDNAKLSMQVSKFENELKAMRRLLLSIAPDRAAEIFSSGFTPLD